MVRRNIAATLLKMLWKNLYSVKCYDKLNMNVFTLSLWENFWWGLIYFDQFINHYNNFLCPQSNFGRQIVIALSVRQSVRVSVRPASCPVHISYIL